MKLTAKVQTNDHKVNVLVETETSSNRHLSHLDKEVIVDKVMSDDEIIKLWENRNDDDESKLKLAKSWISKQNGYAVSNCDDKTSGISHNSVVRYK